MIVVCVITILLFGVRGINVNIGDLKLRIGIPLAVNSIGETDVGIDVKATFNGETGEVRIHSISGIGTIDKAKLITFFNACVKENIISITFDNEVYAPEESDLFRDLTKLKIINNTNNLNVSNTINITAMFNGCSALTSLNLSNWDVSNVQNMDYMFYNCSSLTSVEGLENWDVSKVTTAAGIFNGCSKLINIEDLSNWNTSNISTMSEMFNGCSALTSLNLSNWNVSNVENMRYMFYGCSALTTIGDLSSWNVSKVINITAIFNGCSALTTIGDLSNWNASNVIDMKYMFCECSALTTIGDLSSWDVSNVTDMKYMFCKCSKLTTIGDLSSWNVSNVIDIKAMFNDCTALTSLNLSNWNASKVTTAETMFWNCSSLKNLNLNNWDVRSVTNLDNMFSNCTALTDIGDLSSWKISNVTTMEGMFNNCSSLESLNLSNWGVSKATNMKNMFYNCSSLKNLNLNNWDARNVTNMDNMFYNCSSLESLNLNNCSVSKATNMKNMFYDCSSLNVLNLSNWDMSNVTDVENMFLGCNNLEEIYTPAQLPNNNISIVLPRNYKDVDKPEEGKIVYGTLEKSNNKFSKTVHLFDGIFVSFDLDVAKDYFLDEYTDNIKTRIYKKSELLQFGGEIDTAEKLLPSTTADGKAILWDEEALKNDKGYEFIGWECSYDHQYYDVPFVANYFPGTVEYTAIFKDNNIIRYDLELTNIGKETGKLLSGAKYKIEGKGKDNITEQNYTVSTDGTMKIEGLYSYEEYILTHRKPSNGYKRQEEPVKFRVVKKNNEWQFEVISGNLKSFVFEPSAVEEINAKVKVEWEDEILFKIRKVDSKNEQLGLQGAKFTIKYKDTANDSWENAKDINGKLLGTQENINGEEMYVVTTDENGYILEEVFPGEYEVTEVKEPEGYKLPENPVQYLNIELSQEEKIDATEMWATKFISEESDVLERVLMTKDGGRIFVGQAGNIITSDGVMAPSGKNLVVKYNEKEQRTWGVDFKYDYPNMVTETQDNGLLILGFMGIAKYKKNELYGEPDQEEYVIEWESSIVTPQIANTSQGCFRYVTETSDGGFLVQGRINIDTLVLKDVEQPITINKKGTSDIFLIKYKKEQEGKYVVEWIETIETGGAPFMTSLIETSDGGILLGGAIQGYVTLPDGSRLTNSKTIDNTVLFKYTKKENGEPGYDFNWARRITGDNNKITGITETTDKKYVLVGYLGGTINIPGMEALNTKGGLDNLVMVFNENGEIIKDGVKQIGGSGNELLNHVARMNDGGYITVGSIASDVTLENGQEIKHNQSGKAVTDASQRDAIITRYDRNMNTVWARTYGGVSQDHFTSVWVNDDNNILVGMYFRSDGVILENKEISGGYLEGFTNNNVDSAMIQFKEYVEEPQKVDSQHITITNEKIPMVDIEIIKKWDNTNNKYEKPESVTIELIANIAGVEEKEEIIIRQENKVEIEGEPENQETWSYKITKPQYTKYGEEITYTIKEKSYTLEEKK